MMLWRRRAMWACALGLGAGCLAVAPAVADFDPAEHDGARTLVDELAAQGLGQRWVEDALGKARFRQEVLDAMEGAAERRLRWDEYRAIFLTPTRVKQGVAFIEAHRDAFRRAERDYGVPPEVIAAIIGVETSYGRFTGDHRVLDSLATLAFHHPSRGDFFRGELAAFLAIAHEQEVAPTEPEGSYAGAMGYPQFIPTSYDAYAVDFDDDGLRDLWTNPVDAIGSVANYFAEHGWRPGEPIHAEADGPQKPPESIDFNRTRPPYVAVSELREVGVEPVDALDDDRSVVPLALDEADDRYRYRVGFENFHVITRYNHSHLYAMAVSELSESIATTRDLEAVPLDGLGDAEGER